MEHNFSSASISYGNENRGWIGDVPRFHYNTEKLSHFWQPKLSSAEAVILPLKKSLKLNLNKMYPMNYEEAILVSILIPVFNGDFSEIKESLDSIKNQSYTNFECILVDDSSDENITNSLRHYCDDDQRFYILEDTKKTAWALH